MSEYADSGNINATGESGEERFGNTGTGELVEDEGDIFHAGIESGDKIFIRNIEAQDRGVIGISDNVYVVGVVDGDYYVTLAGELLSHTIVEEPRCGESG